MVTFSVSILAVLSLSMVMVNNSVTREQEASREEVASLFAAEAGISDAVFSLNNGGTGSVGTSLKPMSYADSVYWVEAANAGNGMVTLVSTGIDNRSGSRVELTVQQTQNNMWVWAAFGDEELTMDSNSHIDSYDSTLGSYDSQDVNGNGSNKWADDDGHVGSNGDVTISQNADVHGNAVCGPTSTTSVVGNATVSGSTAPATGLVTLPGLVIPSFPSSGPLDVSGSSTLAAGDYYYDYLTVATGSDLTISGPATIVFNNFELQSNSELWIDATNGPVEIFVIDDFIMNSNTSAASLTYTPADLTINLNSDNVIDPTLNIQLATVNFESNAELYGTIYAPNATVDIDSNFELFGAVVARQVHMSSWSRIHFDEALMNANANGSSSWEAVCWRQMPFKPVKGQGASGNSY